MLIIFLLLSFLYLACLYADRDIQPVCPSLFLLSNRFLGHLSRFNWGSEVNKHWDDCEQGMLHSLFLNLSHLEPITEHQYIDRGGCLSVLLGKHTVGSPCMFYLLASYHNWDLFIFSWVNHGRNSASEPEMCCCMGLNMPMVFEYGCFGFGGLSFCVLNALTEKCCRVSIDWLLVFRLFVCISEGYYRFSSFLSTSLFK